LPNSQYTYSVEALFAGGTGATSAYNMLTIGNFRLDPGTLPNAVPIQASVSGTKSTTMPGQLGASGQQQGSDVTWTWNVPGLVLLYETSYEIVGGVPGIGTVYERVTVPTSGLPPNPPSLTLGVPSGMTVKFCVSFYAFPAPTNILPQEASCQTTTVPAGSSTSSTPSTGTPTSGSSSTSNPQPTGGTSSPPSNTSNTASTVPTNVRTQDLSKGGGWGVGITGNVVPNAVGYRVSRTITGTRQSAIVANVVDVSSLGMSAPGSFGFVDPFVMPSTDYTYWVEALLPGGTAGGPSTISSVTVGNFGQTNSIAIFAPPTIPIQVAVSGTKQVTLPGGFASAGQMSGSDVTWTWTAPQSVILVFETSYELGQPSGFTAGVRDRATIRFDPNAPQTFTTLTRGVPQGFSVRFCLWVYADPDLSKPLPPEASCVVTTVP
jgi:hypothetical protein